MAWRGTPAEKKAYAIKKAREHQVRAAKKDRRTLSGYEVAPCDHPCDVYDIDYKVEIPGTVFAAQCMVCGRTWTRTKNAKGFPVLEVTPPTLEKPSNQEKTSAA